MQKENSFRKWFCAIIVVMDVTYIWSQIFTVVEYGLLGWSYFAKKRKLVVILDIFSMISGIIAFILLGADLGMALSVIVLLANFYYLWDENERKKKDSKKYFVRDYVTIGIVLMGIAVVTFLTYDGPLSLLSVLATTLYEVSIWQKSTKVYKFLGIPVAFCWMSYNGFVRSIFGVICEAGMLISSIWGYVNEIRGSKKKGKRRK